MLPAFVWQVLVAEKNGWSVTVLISTINFHRHIFISVQWCFVKWKESLSVAKENGNYAKPLYLQSTLLLNKTISSVCSGRISLCIPIYHLTLVLLLFLIKFHFHHFCPMVRNHFETFYLLLLLLSGFTRAKTLKGWWKLVLNTERALMESCWKSSWAYSNIEDVQCYPVL